MQTQQPFKTFHLNERKIDIFRVTNSEMYKQFLLSLKPKDLMFVRRFVLDEFDPKEKDFSSLSLKDFFCTLIVENMGIASSKGPFENEISSYIEIKNVNIFIPSEFKTNPAFKLMKVAKIEGYSFYKNEQDLLKKEILFFGSLKNPKKVNL